MRSLVCGLFTLSCTPSAFGPDGFTHPDDQYRITSEGPRILGDDWILDSHFGSLDSLSPKAGPGYTLPFQFDTNGDGTADYSTEIPLYDTRWVHRTHSNVIWTRTIPIPEKFAERDPRVLLTDYVERISGTGTDFVTYQGSVTAFSSRYGTKTLALAPARLDGVTASAADVEVANLDQHQLDASTRTHRVRLVLAHAI